ncbi:MAG: PH domain-containing protein [Thermoplasmata archaeon]
MATPPAPRIDAEGRYRAQGRLSLVIVVVYLILILLVLAVAPSSGLTRYAGAPYLLVGILGFLLLRYLSTSYLLDTESFRARRLVGSRRIPLGSIYRIDRATLRDLSPVGFTGSWGYRGRMWSPFLGSFDAVYTDVHGVLIYGDGVPIFISPLAPDEFVRELSRRSRSHGAAPVEGIYIPQGPAQ